MALSRFVGILVCTHLFSNAGYSFYCDTSVDGQSCDAEYTHSINAKFAFEKERGNNLMKTSTDTHGFNTITKTILLNETNHNLAKEKILQYFFDTFDIFSSLYENVQEKHFWTRSDSLRHPIGWYLAHCACFYVNKLRIGGIIDEPLNNEFESMFAIGVDEMSWDDKLEDRNDWPNVKLVLQYVSQVRTLVTNIIQSLTMELPITWNSKWWVILMGIEHQRIHLETSAVLIRQLPLNTLRKSHSASNIWNNECRIGIFNKSIDFVPTLGIKGHSPKNQLIPLKSSSNVEYGRTIDEFDNLPDYMVPVYGWDNEFGAAIISDVPSFSVSKYLVSNEEYSQFVLDNGYGTKRHWTDEGWRWVQYNNAQYPKFWIKMPSHENNVTRMNEDEQVFDWKYRTLLNIIDMPWDWPVITNQLEAYAFTQWKSEKSGKNIRLPTEDEWFSLRKGFGFDYKDNDIFRHEQPTWINNAPGNINLEFFTSETPVNMFEFGNTGIYDVIGNVWQHTLTPQHPFKGFQVHPWYDDFTTPCFGNQHNLIKGGSWISTGNEAMSYSRYQFRRHFMQFAGIRYIESNRDLSFLNLLSDSSPYNSDEMIDLYAHFHYWDEKYFGVSNFAQNVANTAIKYMNQSMNNKALDLGCAVGRTTFELAKVFNNVTGIDFTARLIGVGYKLKHEKKLEWKIQNEGEIMDHFEVTLEELGLNDDIINKVEFYQNDAQNLDIQYTGYDLIVASNLLDRLSNPMLFLTNIHERINKYGTLVLLSPYTWLEQYTPKDKWIGGRYKMNKEKGEIEAVFAFDELKDVLSEWFTLTHNQYVEMVIRETANKFQHTRSHLTVWTKL